jgi:hypothetical protein
VVETENDEKHQSFSTFLMVRLTRELIKKKSEHNESVMGDLEEISLHQVMFFFNYECEVFLMKHDNKRNAAGN